MKQDAAQAQAKLWDLVKNDKIEGSHETAALLLKQGADANKPDSSGDTPLSYAIKKIPPQLDVIKDILDSEHFTFTDFTYLALHAALTAKQKEWAEKILNKHKDKTISINKQQNGSTVLEMAVANDYYDLAIAMLTTHGADPNGKRIQTNTAWHTILSYAVTVAQVPLVEAIIKAGYKASAEDAVNVVLLFSRVNKQAEAQAFLRIFNTQNPLFSTTAAFKLLLQAAYDARNENLMLVLVEISQYPSQLAIQRYDAGQNKKVDENLLVYAAKQNNLILVKALSAHKNRVLNDFAYDAIVAAISNNVRNYYHIVAAIILGLENQSHSAASTLNFQDSIRQVKTRVFKYAINIRNLDIALYMLAHQDVNVHAAEGDKSLLELAVELNSVELIEKMIKYDFSVGRHLYHLLSAMDRVIEMGLSTRVAMLTKMMLTRNFIIDETMREIIVPSVSSLACVTKKSLFVLAVEKNDLDVVKLLLANGANYKQMINGQTALYYAATTGKLSIVSAIAGLEKFVFAEDAVKAIMALISKREPDVIAYATAMFKNFKSGHAGLLNTVQNEQQQTVLEMAIDADNVPLVTLLIEKGAYALGSKNKESLLLRAINAGKFAVAEALINSKHTPLHISSEILAATIKRQFNIVKSIIEKFKNEIANKKFKVDDWFDGKEAQRRTAFGIAVENGDDDLAKLLLDHGADPFRYLVAKMHRLLEFAIKNSRKDIEAHVFSNAKSMDVNAFIAVALAMQSKDFVLANKILALMPANNDISKASVAVQQAAAQALKIAVEGDQPASALVPVLIAKGVSPNAKINGKSLLRIAVENGDVNTINKLLKLKADPNTVDADGQTALSWAVREGKLDSNMKYAMNIASDYNLTWFTTTALYYSGQNKTVEVAKIVTLLLKDYVFTAGSVVAMFSAMESDQLEIYETIWNKYNSKNNVDLDTPVNGKMTLLAYFLENRHMSDVQLFLSLGADPHLGNGEKDNAVLQQALLRNDMELVKIILENKKFKFTKHVCDHVVAGMKEQWLEMVIVEKFLHFALNNHYLTEAESLIKAGVALKASQQELEAFLLKVLANKPLSIVSAGVIISHKEFQYSLAIATAVSNAYNTADDDVERNNLLGLVELGKQQYSQVFQHPDIAVKPVSALMTILEAIVAGRCVEAEEKIKAAEESGRGKNATFDFDAEKYAKKTALELAIEKGGDLVQQAIEKQQAVPADNPYYKLARILFTYGASASKIRKEAISKLLLLAINGNSEFTVKIILASENFSYAEHAETARAKANELELVEIVNLIDAKKPVETTTSVILERVVGKSMIHSGDADAVSPVVSSAATSVKPLPNNGTSSTPSSTSKLSSLLKSSVNSTLYNFSFGGSNSSSNNNNNTVSARIVEKFEGSMLVDMGFSRDEMGAMDSTAPAPASASTLASTPASASTSPEAITTSSTTTTTTAADDNAEWLPPGYISPSLRSPSLRTSNYNFSSPLIANPSSRTSSSAARQASFLDSVFGSGSSLNRSGTMVDMSGAEQHHHLENVNRWVAESTTTTKTVTSAPTSTPTAGASNSSAVVNVISSFVDSLASSASSVTGRKGGRNDKTDGSGIEMKDVKEKSITDHTK